MLLIHVAFLWEENREKIHTNSSTLFPFVDLRRYSWFVVVTVVYCYCLVIVSHSGLLRL